MNNYDELLVLLLANVATQYVEIRTLQRRLELARSNVALQEPLVAAYQKRYNAGIANAYPGYVQLLSNLENTRALIPQLEISLRQANNQLCILLGQPVYDLLPELGDGTVPDPSDPKKRVVRIPNPKDPSIVLGIPGEFLLRRPDVKASEDQLKIQSAQIGIAEAEMFPHIGINGSIGLASSQFRTLFEGKSFTGTIGPSLTWNILNYGRLLANGGGAWGQGGHGVGGAWGQTEFQVNLKLGLTQRRRGLGPRGLVTGPCPGTWHLSPREK